MKVSLARITSIYAYAAKFSRPNPPQILPLTNAATSFNLRRFLSSDIPKPSESNSQQPHDADSLSNEELKREIKKLYDGDTNAFSSIFETVLKRKLSGKSDRLDEDLVKELGNVLGSQESLDSEEDDDIGVESESDKRPDSVRTYGGNSNSLNIIWSKHAQKKISVYMWRLFNMILPFDDVLKYCRFNIASKCPFCQNCDSIDHFYNECLFPLHIWRESLKMVFIRDTDFNSAWSRISYYLTFKGFTSLHSKVIHALTSFICWSLWKARNSFLHEGKKPVDIIVLKEIKESVFNAFASKPVFISSQFDSELSSTGILPFLKKTPKPKIFPTSWRRPMQGIKLNVDASWSAQHTGIGCIFRNQHGNFLKGKSFFTNATSPLEAEIKAIWHGLNYACSQGFTSFIIESDCLTAISMIKNPITAHWKLFQICDQVSQVILKENCTLEHVHREANQPADAIAKWAMSQRKEETLMLQSLPQKIRGLIILDKEGTPAIRISRSSPFR